MDETSKGIANSLSNTAIKILKKGLKEMDKEFDAWGKVFEGITEDARTKLSSSQKSSAGNDKSTVDIYDFLEKLTNHIKNLRSYDLSGFIEEEGRSSIESFLGLASGDDEPVVSKSLEREYWHINKTDSSKIKFQKRWFVLKTTVRRIVSGLLRNEKPGWGKQHYFPQLLVANHLVIPVLDRISSLLGKRMREHARHFNYLHHNNEQELKDLITSSLTNTPEQTAVSEEDQSSVNEDRALIKPELSKKSDYEKQLDEFISQRQSLLEPACNRAGTSLMAESEFSSQENKKEYDIVLKNCGKLSGRWKKYFEAEVNDWDKDLEIIAFQLQILEINSSSREQLHRKFEEKISPLFDQLLSVAGKSFEDIKQAENSPEFRDKILNESRQSLRTLRLKNIPGLIDAFNEAQFIKVIENFGHRISYRFNSLGEKNYIIQKLNIEKEYPEITIREINLKKIIENEYLGPLKDNTDQLIEGAEHYLSKVFRSINEIDNMIRINLEAALELIDEKDAVASKKEDVGKIVTQGLDRIYSVIEKVKPETKTVIETWGYEMQEFSSEFVKDIDKLKDNENILNLIIRQAKAEASRHYSEIRKKAGKSIKNNLVKTWKVISFGMSGAQTSYEHLVGLTGAAAISEGERGLMNYLYTTRKKINALPYIYQRLYQLEALKDIAMFSGREDQLNRIDTIFQLWRSGNFASVAIVGEKGSGRTSLINIAETNLLKQVKHYRISLPKNITTESALASIFSEVSPEKKPSSLDELEEILNSTTTPLAIVVENLQNLFIRTINGFDLIERFLLMMSRVPEKVFWIISCGVYMWNYLDSVLFINRYFYDLIFLDDLKPEVIEEIILTRHRLSGFDLEYQPSESDLNDRRYKKLTSEKDRQAFLEREFFKDLQNLTGGNISIALLRWQLSVKSIKPDKVYIQTDPYFNPQFLHSLEDEELFTLELIIELEVLTIEEHAEIFKIDKQQSERILLRLKNKGILFRTSDGFQIHLLVFKQILKVLDSKNILK